MTPPFEEDMALHLNKRTKFDGVWPADSGEEEFSKFSVYFYPFTIISSWKGAIPFL
jgi:hypothetical protein